MLNQPDFLVISAIQSGATTKYLEYYPRKSFLFLLMEDLLQPPLQALNQICQFIGVNPDIDLTQSGEIVANQGKDLPELYVRKLLTAPLKSVPSFSFDC